LGKTGDVRKFIGLHETDYAEALEFDAFGVPEGDGRRTEDAKALQQGLV
jgi:hypothetical protein